MATAVEKSKNLNESIIQIRVDLQNAKIKKSGTNKYAGFSYYELADFLPKLNELMQIAGINDRFTIESSIEGDYAKLELIKGDEKQEYKIPFKIFETPVNTKVNKETGEVREVKSMQDIQYLGALNTYYKRYLYLNAFGITDGEVIDAMNNEDVTTEKKTTKKEAVTQKLATESQIKIITEKFTSEELKTLLPKVKKEKVEDLTIAEASSLIKLKEKK